MNEIEKRELLEQQRKIFEAGAQRADKRTGSFNFLTWSFFLAPLMASDESLAATLKFAAAEEEYGKAAQAGAAAPAANDYPPAADSSETSTVDGKPQGPAPPPDPPAAQPSPTRPFRRP